MSWPHAERIETARLTLEPLRADHADEMFAILDDRALHEYTGGEPPSSDSLRARYARQVAGHSPDGTQGWLNWVLRHRERGEAVGTVQATLSHVHRGMSAELAWTVAVAHQRHGYAREAADAMAVWVARAGATRLTAHIHPSHAASIAVARHLGLTPTDVTDGGETLWVSDA
jgi:RimJ/RimL family protein N-acetyltransferase